MAKDGTSSRGLNVAIVGGGLGGLCAAAFLYRAGVQVTVFEQAPELSYVGAGINMGPNAGLVLHHLGLTEAMNKAGEIIETGWEFRRWQDGSVLFAQERGPRGQHGLRRYGAHGYFIHRADLLEILLSVVPAGNIALGRKCTRLEQDENGCRLWFADGSTAEADAVIGADGIHSCVRDAVVERVPTTFSGLCAWRCLIPAPQVSSFALRPAQTLWVGPGRHVVHYPIRNRTWVNAVAITPVPEWNPETWAGTGDVSELVAEFEGWDGRLTDVLAASATILRSPLLEREPLPRWVAGRIALLGDSAHPMFPFLAQGAGQAFEDAACLGACLAGVEAADAASALNRYQRLRMARATEVQQRSREASDREHLPDGPQQRLRDERLARHEPLEYNSWLYDHDALGQASAASSF
ncbi:MAG TPA: FAD-dependent monooxygenase [Trebonia sp.]|nr:FAD-dependent monooxygenase [Trebonia sp.]